jgi:hypothetical protein
MTPDEARREARRHLSDVERGLDPAEQLLQERNAITVADLCREYLPKAEAGLIIGAARQRGVIRSVVGLPTRRCQHAVGMGLYPQ